MMRTTRPPARALRAGARGREGARDSNRPPNASEREGARGADARAGTPRARRGGRRASRPRGEEGFLACPRAEDRRGGESSYPPPVAPSEALARRASSADPRGARRGSRAGGATEGTRRRDAPRARGTRRPSPSPSRPAARSSRARRGKKKRKGCQRGNRDVSDWTNRRAPTSRRRPPRVDGGPGGRGGREPRRGLPEGRLRGDGGGARARDARPAPPAPRGAGGNPRFLFRVTRARRRKRARPPKVPPDGFVFPQSALLLRPPRLARPLG